MLMENRGVHSGCLFAAELKPSGEPLGDEEGGEDGEEANEQSKDLDSKEEVARAECSDSDYRPSPRQRPRSRRAAARGRPARRTSYSKGNNKKKVGRPITYKGDPEASNLTEEEKRRIKRRIANRESARRVRQKRHDLMEDLQVNIETMQQRNGKLLAHCGRIEKQKAAVMGQMAEMQEKWGQAASEGSRLQAEIATMRQTLEVNMRFMENAGARIQGPGSLQQHNGPMPHYAGDLPAQDVLQGNAVMLPTNMSSPFKTAFQDFVSSVPLWT
ncbi:hypothetical protein WJX75_009443 [Coccomyxa subellipsoidea]|uniref:BZIP domain-containing protein n=1 Tax=Coccomyxa subellipsoidea TaxID=248742 RepID=A0ABR2Z135_9CHLO